MLLFFFFILFLITNADDDFVSFGLNTDFEIIPDTFKECTFHNSCYDILCEEFKINASCVSYVVFTPLSDNIDCSIFLAYRKVNMIMFGLDKNRKIVSPQKCGSIGGCFQIGCTLYNSNPNVTWVAFTGSCE